MITYTNELDLKNHQSFQALKRKFNIHTSLYNRVVVVKDFT